MSDRSDRKPQGKVPQRLGSIGAAVGRGQRFTETSKLDYVDTGNEQQLLLARKFFLEDINKLGYPTEVAQLVEYD